MADWNWVTPRIALGSEPTAADLSAMRRQGITDVLDLRGEPRQNERAVPELYWGTGISYHYLPMLDRGGEQPVAAYQQGVQIALDVLANPSKRLLIHCSAGQYRSPSMVYAVLRALGYSPSTAWATIRAARPIVQDQYVNSAERAVPYLPRGASSSGKAWALAAVAVGALGLVVYYNNPRAFG